MLLKKMKSIKGLLLFLLLSIILLFLGITWAYYAFVSNLIREREKSYVQDLLFQISENIQTSSNEMISYAKILSSNRDTQAYLTSDTPLDSLASANQINSIIFDVTQDSQDTFIAIMNTSGQKTLATIPILSVLEHLSSEYDIYNSSNSGFTGSIRNMYDSLDYYAYYQPIINIRASATPNQRIGVCVVISSITRLQKCIGQIDASPNSIFIIMDQNQNIITSNQPKNSEYLREISTGTIAASAADVAKDSSIQVIGGQKSIVFMEEVSATGWKVIGIIPQSEIDSDLSPLLQFGTLLLGLLLVVFLFWMGRAFKWIISPVMQISSFVQTDAYSALHTRLHVESDNEIGQLALSINKMLDEISDMTQAIFQNQAKMYELDLSKKQAELSALQSQMNPHFLYNTLDCIKGYGYLLDNNEIVTIVDSLSRIMRYCIKGADIVTLREELDIIQCYLKIISIRFENRFLFSINIPEALMSLRLPRFILQPLAENAVSHGLEPYYGTGQLSIYCEENEADIFLCVRDTGVGIPEDILTELNSRLRSENSDMLFHLPAGKGLALLNTNFRIRQHFGDDYGLSIESAPGEGTLIKIRLPRALS